ncbi:MAG: acyl-CoA dehydratase activase [Dethiobacteria bacterium]
MLTTIGVDVGSASTKIVLLHKQKMYSKIRPTGWSPRDAGHQILEDILEEHALTLQEIDYAVATGYGRAAVTYAQKEVTEITCHGRGAVYLLPEVDTIIDIGGQDSKVIKIAPGGKVQDFMMNDKCAAGTGRFLGVMANALGLDVAELGRYRAAKPAAINNMCTVFAESEVIGLLARGTAKDTIISGLHQAVARRTGSMIKKMGPYHTVTFTGGVALNAGVHRCLEEELGTRILVSEHCQIAGALGAALLARDCCL